MKGDVMKPYYSIEELAHILHDPIYKVANGLVACGVVPIYESNPADLSQWASLGPDTRGEEIFINIGEYPVPDPSRVVVNSEALPQLWKDCISAEEQKNLLTPTADAAADKPESTRKSENLLRARPSGSHKRPLCLAPFG